MSDQIEAGAYGVLMAREGIELADLVVEELQTLGYSVVEQILPTERVDSLRAKAANLLERNAGSQDSNIVRAPWSQDIDFLDLAKLPLVQQIVHELIPGRVVLNQQNLVRSPGSSGSYSQAKYHRDLPYQHFVASRPLAINVLVCLDDFAVENGATAVLPASHKEELFPSQAYIDPHAIIATASRGSLLFLHGMTYHSGRKNMTDRDRIAVNHVFSSPLLRPQLDHRKLLGPETERELDTLDRALLDLVG